MAQTSFRIDDVTPRAGGGFTIAYTWGKAPLPVEPSGSAMEFDSRAQVAAQLVEVEESFSPLRLFMMRLAIYAKQNNDPNLTKLTPAMLRGKSFTIDLSTSANVTTVE